CRLRHNVTGRDAASSRHMRRTSKTLGRGARQDSAANSSVLGLTELCGPNQG
ncbi:hypothetical protein BaRGS_00012791, partial [Batillaria attramentaria]